MVHIIVAYLVEKTKYLRIAGTSPIIKGDKMVNRCKYLVVLMTVLACAFSQAAPVSYTEASDGDIIPTDDGSTLTGPTFTLDEGVNSWQNNISTPSDSSDTFLMTLPANMEITSISWSVVSFSGGFGGVSLFVGGTTPAYASKTATSPGVSLTDTGFDDEPTLPSGSTTFTNTPVTVTTSTTTFNVSWTLTITVAAAADNTAPTITSIARQTPSTSPTNADTLVFRVTFDEDVENVGTNDFEVTGTTGNVTSVTGDGAVYDVTISGGDLAGLNGTVDLDVAAGNDVQDTAGNPLGSTPGIGSEDTFSVDNTAPTVATIVRLDGSPTNADSIQYTVTFSEDVTDVDTADFTVTTVSGDATGTVSLVTAVNASTYTVTVDNVTGDGDIRLDVIAEAP